MELERQESRGTGVPAELEQMESPGRGVPAELVEMEMGSRGWAAPTELEELGTESRGRGVPTEREEMGTGSRGRGVLTELERMEMEEKEARGWGVATAMVQLTTPSTRTSGGECSAGSCHGAGWTRQRRRSILVEGRNPQGS